MNESRSDEFNNFTTDWKNRIQSVIRLTVLLSGGVLSITIGMFVDEGRAALPPDAVNIIRMAWYALALSLMSSVLMPFVLVVSGAMVLREWKKEINEESSKSSLLDVPIWVYRTGFILLTVSVLGCVIGLALMAIGAGHAIQPVR